MGWGETGRVNAADVEKARSALLGRSATAYAVTMTGTALDPAINSAMLDITAKACSAPVYRLLGGPTRFKARALAALQGDTDSELASSLAAGTKAGYRAFEVPLPPYGVAQSGTGVRQGRQSAHGSTAVVRSGECELRVARRGNAHGG